MKTLAILTGPQGSGNHLWSKIFSLHEDVYGWKSLLDNYWEAHRYSEPFAACWREPDLLSQFDFSTHNHFFTSISVPLGIESKGTKWCPDVKAFGLKATSLGLKVKICVIGRDQTILQNQQQRIREESTIRHFYDALTGIQEAFPCPTFLSYELLYLYKAEYLKSLDLGFPIAWYDKRLPKILELDANRKYIHTVKTSPLDECNKTGIPSPWNPNIEEEKPIRQRDHAFDEEGTNSTGGWDPTDPRSYRHEIVTGQKIDEGCDCC